MSKYSCHAILLTGLALLGHALAIIITGGLIGRGYDIFPQRLDGSLSFSVAGSSLTDRDDTWEAMVADPQNTMWSQTLSNQSTRSLPVMPTQLLYTGRCLTRSNLASIQLLEASLLTLSAYELNLCMLHSAGGCQAPRSLLRFFDGSFQGYGVMSTVTPGLNVFRPDDTFDRIDEIITTAYEANGKSYTANLISAGNPNLRVILDYHLSAGELMFHGRHEGDGYSAGVCCLGFVVLTLSHVLSICCTDAHDGGSFSLAIFQILLLVMNFRKTLQSSEAQFSAGVVI